jgi:tetratricopeptide (TPR) repeat protein
MVVIRDCTKDGELRSLWNFPRLFRNHVGAKYVGAVHNQVLVPGGVAFSDLAIEHFGYDLSPVVMRKKFRRTVTLLRKLHKENPQDPFATYFLANSYCAYRRFRHAIVWGEKTLDRLRALDKAPAHYMSVYSTLITSAMQLRRYPEVKRYCHEAIQLYPRYLDAHYYLAAVSFMSKDFTSTVTHGDDYYSTRDFMLADPANCSTIMHFTLNNLHWIDYYYGFSLLMTSQAEKGRDHLFRAVQTRNIKAQMIVEIVHNLLAVGKPEIARAVVEKVLESHAGKTEVLLSLARELLDDGFYAWLEEAAPNLPEPQIVEDVQPLARGISQMIRGKNQAAIETLAAVPPDDQHRQLALLLASEIGHNGAANVAFEREKIVEKTRTHTGSPAMSYAAGAWLMQQQRALEVLTMPAAEKIDSENSALCHMQRLQAAALCNAVDDMLAVFVKLVQAAKLEAPGQLDSLAEVSNCLLHLANFYKRNLWHDAATEAVRLAWWFDLGNKIVEAQYYAMSIENTRAFGRSSPVIRAVLREALPRPNFTEPLTSAVFQESSP